MNNPKPSLKSNPRFQDPNLQKLLSDNLLVENIDGVPVYFVEGERPFNQPNSTLKMGPRLQKERQEADPKLKAQGSEISKKVGEIRARESDIKPLDEENDSPIIGKPINITGKKGSPGQGSNEVKPKVLVQEEIRKGEKSPYMFQEGSALDLRKKSEDEQLLKEKEELKRQLEAMKKEIQQRKDLENEKSLKEKEELKRELETMKKELEQSKLALKKNSNAENGVSQDEWNESNKEKERLMIQLNQADQAYDESMKIVDSLLEQIKNHINAELKFYEKVMEKMESEEGFQTQGKKGQEGDKEKEFMEMQYIIFGMRRECNELLKKLRERPWTKPEIEEAKEFLLKIQDNRNIKTENLKLKTEDKKNKAAIQQLDFYIKELEDQVNNLGNDSKNANKNNVMKVLQLTKDLKANGLKEAELSQDLETLKAQFENLREDIDQREANERKNKENSNKKIEELTQQVLEREDIMVQIQDQMMKLLKRNQQLKEKLDGHQEELDSVRVQLNHYKEKEVNMYSTNSGTPRSLKPKTKSPHNSIGSLGDVNKADMEWLKLRVGENTDWMMMLHLQSLALEDSMKRCEHYDRLEKMVSPQMLASPQFLHKDGTSGTGPETNSRFSFGQYLGLK